VPRVEVLVAGLRGSPLTLRTQTLLMHHYERVGDFGKAEDSFFAMLEGEPGDAALAAGKLPRAELEAGVAELRGRKAVLAGRSG
jgi:hypothetical protein